MSKKVLNFNGYIHKYLLATSRHMFGKVPNSSNINHEKIIQPMEMKYFTHCCKLEQTRDGALV